MKYIVDITKPPIGPPMRTIKEGLFGKVETGESVKNTLLWKLYIVEYGQALKSN